MFLIISFSSFSTVHQAALPLHNNDSSEVDFRTAKSMTTNPDQWKN